MRYRVEMAELAMADEADMAAGCGCRARGVVCGRERAGEGETGEPGSAGDRRAASLPPLPNSDEGRVSRHSQLSMAREYLIAAPWMRLRCLRRLRAGRAMVVCVYTVFVQVGGAVFSCPIGILGPCSQKHPRSWT